MKRTVQKSLKVADHNMNQGKPSRCFCWRCYFLLVFMRFSNCIECWKCICSNFLAILQMAEKESMNMFLVYVFHDLCSHEASMLTMMLHGNKNGCLPCRSSTTFTGLLASNIGIVDFN